MTFDYQLLLSKILSKICPISEEYLIRYLTKNRNPSFKPSDINISNKSINAGFFGIKLALISNTESCALWALYRIYGYRITEKVFPFFLMNPMSYYYLKNRYKSKNR
jgi:hypothetical protein